MAPKHWIFAASLQQARYHAMSAQLRDWRYAQHGLFRGVRLTDDMVIHILDGFENEQLEIELQTELALSLGVPQVHDLRGRWEFPDLHDPAALEAWLNA